MLRETNSRKFRRFLKIFNVLPQEKGFKKKGFQSLLSPALSYTHYVSFSAIMLHEKSKPLNIVFAFSLAFGTILFSFGGASIFPTVQTDMKKSSRFPLSVVWAYAVVITMYLPVTVMGFVVYGKDITSNILNSVKHGNHDTKGVLLDIVLVLITLHLLFSFVIALNPVSQQFEELFKLPHGTHLLFNYL